jgi:hypothetical protein
MRRLGSVMMFAGNVLAGVTAFIAWRGQNMRINDISLDGFNGFALAGIALGAFLTVSGAVIRRRALHAERDRINA